MLRHRSTAAIFPIVMLLALVVERMATWLLGTFPGERAVWMISGELRKILRPASDALTALSGGSLALQAMLIAIFLVAVWGALSTKRWEAPALVLNHLGLIAFLAVSHISSGASTAGLSFAGWQSNEASLFFIAQPSGLQLAMLATGVAGCVVSHVFFLRNVRARHQAVAAAITGLCVEAADRRSASRNRLSRIR